MSHAGTREGAPALGLGRGRAYLEKRELPAPLQVLTPAEIEILLCLYKGVCAPPRRGACRPV